MAMDEDALLAQAIAMSMSAESGSGDINMVDQVFVTPTPKVAASSTAAAPAAATSAAVLDSDVTAALSDPSFLDELLDGLPGVDKNEINIDVRALMLLITID